MNFQQLLQDYIRLLALRTPGWALRYFAEEYRSYLNTLSFGTHPFAPLKQVAMHADRQPTESPGRLFYVSPLPPDHSGIARYSVDLLPELMRHFNVVLVHPTLNSVVLNGQETPVHPPEWMLANWTVKDQVLYHIGNSPFHTYMLELMQRKPGFVVLHDVYLSHLLYHEYSENKGDATVVQHLLGSHGIDGLRAVCSASPWGEKVLDFPCSGLVVQYARHVFVYSRHARDLIEQYYGQTAANKVTVLKMPIPGGHYSLRNHKQLQARQALNIASETFLVCCFGIIQANKHSGDVLNAWLALGWHEHADKKLVFVGGYNPAEPHASNMLRTLASLPEGTRNIEVLGWVDDSRYEQYLCACNLAVQLRTNTRGETSAALLHTLTYGVPTLINAHGSMAELPDGVVHKLTDEFTPQLLQESLQELAQSPEVLSDLSKKAAAFAEREHEPARLMQEFSLELKQFNSRALGTAGVKREQIIVWVDCSFMVLTGPYNVPSYNAHLQAYRQLLETRDSSIKFQFVRFDEKHRNYVYCPLAHGLPECRLSKAYYTLYEPLIQPALLIVDPRIRWFAYTAICKAKRRGAKLVYLRPNALNTVFALVAQDMKCSLPE